MGFFVFFFKVTLEVSDLYFLTGKKKTLELTVQKVIFNSFQLESSSFRFGNLCI